MTNFETTAADRAVRELDVEEFHPVILGDGAGRPAAWTIASAIDRF